MLPFQAPELEDFRNENPSILIYDEMSLILLKWDTLFA
jgi:hypothetical protein